MIKHEHLKLAALLAECAPRKMNAGQVATYAEDLIKIGRRLTRHHVNRCNRPLRQAEIALAARLAEDAIAIGKVFGNSVHVDDTRDPGAALAVTLRDDNADCDVTINL